MRAHLRLLHFLRHPCQSAPSKSPVSSCTSTLTYLLDKQRKRMIKQRTILTLLKKEEKSVTEHPQSNLSVNHLDSFLAWWARQREDSSERYNLSVPAILRPNLRE
ncbi:hypothetical protein CDAR_96811 [Caerostris darwini]|uniref:Uncharacterized protein n=1 Tax=Caerostris darwini TaxID=1538125 RepID=A0AAV4QZ99_9ARAC|nr:hypothetical protein CDAR_96811 [Caerostris darwini]